MRRTLRAVCLGVGLLVLGVTPVAAAPVEHGVWTLDAEFTWQECDGFDIIAAGTFWGVDNVFEDPSDDERIMQLVRFDLTLYNSETGEAIGSAVSRNVLLAPLDGLLTSTYVGMRIRESYAGGGSFVSIGRIEYNGAGEPIFVAGPHPFETDGVDRCALVPA